MPVEAIPTWLAALFGFTGLAIFVILILSVAYAKRDVTINITFIELNR